jgi:hypothetical protein
MTAGNFKRLRKQLSLISNVRKIHSIGRLACRQSPSSFSKSICHPHQQQGNQTRHQLIDFSRKHQRPILLRLYQNQQIYD